MLNKPKKRIQTATKHGKYIIPAVALTLATVLGNVENTQAQTNNKTTTIHAAKTVPDTTEIKNFFLKGTFLTPAEMKDFDTMRHRSIKSPSRPATYLTICDIRETSSKAYEKAIFTTAFLDPFQTTALGKQAFQEINKNKSTKRIFGTYCKMYIQNIKTIKLDKEDKKLDEKNKKLDEKNKKLDETLKLLQQIEDVYKQYLNK